MQSVCRIFNLNLYALHTSLYGYVGSKNRQFILPTDLCEDINAYNEAEKWWKSLSTQEMLDLATVFESEFGILNHNEVSDEAEVELYDKWAQIPIDDRHRIFLIVTKSE